VSFHIHSWWGVPLHVFLWSLKTFLRVSKTVTRPWLTATTINNPVKGIGIIAVQATRRFERDQEFFANYGTGFRFSHGPGCECHLCRSHDSVVVSLVWDLNRFSVKFLSSSMNFSISVWINSFLVWISLVDGKK
jgi:hypothetical protein